MTTPSGQSPEACSRCGSSQLLACDVVTAESGFGGGPLRIAKKERLPDGRVRVREVMVTALACAACGKIHFEAADLTPLRDVLQAERTADSAKDSPIQERVEQGDEPDEGL